MFHSVTVDDTGSDNVPKFDLVGPASSLIKFHVNFSSSFQRPIIIILYQGPRLWDTVASRNNFKNLADWETFHSTENERENKKSKEKRSNKNGVLSFVFMGEVFFKGRGKVFTLYFFESKG